jgi:acyl-coenzyme A thioesterase PaaI-like protein
VSTEPDQRPDVLAQACADVMWAADAGSRELGIELDEVRAGRSRARMRVTVFAAAVHRGDELVAEARERVRFGRSGIYDVTVRRRADGAVVAEFRGHSRTTGGAILEARG